MFASVLSFSRTNEVVPEIPDLDYAYVVPRLNGQVPGYSKHRTVLQLLYDVVVLEYSSIRNRFSCVLLQESIVRLVGFYSPAGTFICWLEDYNPNHLSNSETHKITGIVFLETSDSRSTLVSSAVYITSSYMVRKNIPKYIFRLLCIAFIMLM